MKLKSVLVAAALMGITGVASASSGLSFVTLSTGTRNESFSPFNGGPPLNHTPIPFVPDYGATLASLGTTYLPGSTVDLGEMVATQSERVTFTFIGANAGYNDNIQMLVFPFGSLHDHLPAATQWATVSETVGAGVIPFEFEGNVNCTSPSCGSTIGFGDTGPTEEAENGPESGWCSRPGAFQCSIGLLATNATILGHHFSYVIGYDDSAGGVSHDWNDMVVGVNAIPEPEVYAMLAAGLGLMGFVARRRKSQGAV